MGDLLYVVLEGDLEDGIWDIDLCIDILFVVYVFIEICVVVVEWDGV